MATPPPDPETDARHLALEDEVRQFRLLLNGVTDYAIYMLDRDGYITTWNEGGQRIKGYSATEIVGSHFSRFYTPDDIASVVIDPIWSDGELIGYAKVTRDITERIDAQRQIHDGQLALLQAQKMEAIGKLTLGLSHDFNNLLAVVINALDLIAMRVTDDPRVTRNVEAALRAAERGALLTRQLLTFGRGQPLSPQRTAINQILLDLSELMRRSCAENIAIDFSLADGLPAIDVDRTQLEAAVLNMVVNSRDAMPHGGTLTLATGSQRVADPSAPGAPEQDMLCVSVTDDGEGIPADLQQRVFEPFFTTKEIGKGSGLGLSQIFGFALQSGGHAALRSAPGEGTTVSLYLPMTSKES